ncbi:uncharacterized protein LOC121371366 isoform X2 [Gigantopelta aegis]|uniref:uncharacterized protein LOC121371366 isoform X2 n=1 Tax=Gigantopelta aegis TaxID=1735272 RepID=UPI001B888CF1|nr:uncharacterized protein LOC121371366 isoform X2 [Gigantopelta aegis]XP_041353134.1 uncharacterized protein LOC121371366 isoform X2 [Gigantopelta aegis]XP_041353135.1 uncharacterized protein LOC121371366 isoform X2 [Gigantopelta aegis]
MASLWNQKDLAEPPMCCTVVSVTPDNTGHLSELKDILQECVTQLDSQSHLSAEVFVLSSLIYKKNCQLRLDKAMQGLKLVSKCLTRYSGVDIHQIAVKLLEGFSSYSSESVPKTSLYLPSQQAMEHFLVKLVGVTCLLSQAVGYAVHTFILIQQRLCRGHLTTTYIVFLSAISRVWAICKSQALVFLSWYTRLLPAIHVLTPTEVKWIPDNDSLPADLAQHVYAVTGVHIGTRKQDDDLTDMFEKIRNEHEESMKIEGQIDQGEGHIKDETDTYNNNEDIGVPIKKLRTVNHQAEDSKRKQKNSDEIKKLPSKKKTVLSAETNHHLRDREYFLGCVKEAHSFVELKSLLINVKKHTPSTSHFQSDWKTSMTGIKSLKKKSSLRGKSGEKAIVTMRDLKHAKYLVRSLVIKYSTFRDLSTDKNVISACESMQKTKTQELKEADAGKTAPDPDPSSSPNLETGRLDSELQKKRKHLKSVIKILKESSQFELAGKIVHICSAECGKLRKQLQQVLKQLKKTKNVEVRDLQREMDLLNEVDSLLENAAVQQLKLKNSSVLQTSKSVINKGKSKPSKNKEDRVHAQKQLVEQQNDMTQAIKIKKVTKLGKDKTVRKKH